MSATNKDLPAGWKWIAFGEAAEHRLGKMLDKGKNVGTLRPYLRNVNVRWHGFDLSDVGEMRVGDDEMEKYSVRKGDLVICEGGEPGRAAIWQRDEPIAYQKAVHRARTREGVEAKWLLYLLEHEATSGRLAKHFTGSTINHLTGKALANVRVPLAPPAEQRRIVDAVEELFSDLDAGEAALRDAKARLVRYRQSVLNAAVTGALTAAWREAHPDTEPADALPARLLTERREAWEADTLAKYETKGTTPPKGWQKKYLEPEPVETSHFPDLPGTWASVTFETICDHRLGKMLDKGKNVGTLRPYLRNVSVRWHHFDLSDLQEMRVTDEEMDKYSVNSGDLMICEGGEAGRAAIWKSGEPVVYQKVNRPGFAGGSHP